MEILKATDLIRHHNEPVPELLSREIRKEYSEDLTIEYALALRVARKFAGTVAPEEVPVFLGPQSQLVWKLGKPSRIDISPNMAGIGEEAPFHPYNMDALIGHALHEASHMRSGLIDKKKEVGFGLNQVTYVADQNLTLENIIDIGEELYVDHLVRRHYPAFYPYIKRARGLAHSLPQDLPIYNLLLAMLVYGEPLPTHSGGFALKPSGITQIQNIGEWMEVLMNKDQTPEARLTLYKEIFDRLRNEVPPDDGSEDMQEALQDLKDQTDEIEEVYKELGLEPPNMEDILKQAQQIQELQEEQDGQKSGDDSEESDGKGAEGGEDSQESNDSEPDSQGTGGGAPGVQGAQVQEQDEKSSSSGPTESDSEEASEGGGSDEDEGTTEEPEPVDPFIDQDPPPPLDPGVEGPGIPSSEHIRKALEIANQIADSTALDNMDITDEVKSDLSSGTKTLIDEVQHLPSSDSHVDLSSIPLSPELRELERIHNAKDRIVLRAKTEGKIHRRRLARHRTSRNIRKQIRRRPDQKSEVVMLLDASGSMRVHQDIYTEAARTYKSLTSGSVKMIPTYSYSTIGWDGRQVKLLNLTWDNHLRKTIPSRETPSGQALLATLNLHPEAMILHFTDGEPNSGVLIEEAKEIQKEKYPKSLILNVIYGRSKEIHRRSPYLPDTPIFRTVAINEVGGWVQLLLEQARDWVKSGRL